MFAEFSPQNTAEWREAIQKVLKGQSPDTLQTPLYEGFSTQPFYNQDDRIAPLLQESDFLPFHTCLNVVPILASELATDLATAEELTDKGADLVCFVFEDDTDVSPYFACRVPFGIRRRGKNLPALPANENWSYAEASPDANALKNLSAPFRKLLHVDFQPFEDAGANAIQTVAYGFNAMVELADKLTDAGCSPAEVFSNMRITVSIGGNYFVEIAKLRAIRVLWRNILLAYQAPFEPLYIHAVATNRNKYKQDRYNNLLRNTTEAMAGIVGGADSFEALPYTSPFAETSQEDTLFAQRIARNMLVLLKEEAHLDKITDASAGSYYIEWLTKEIAEKSWALFQETEAKGGFSAHKTEIDAQIARVAEQREADFQAGKAVFVGVNKYPNKSEAL